MTKCILPIITIEGASTITQFLEQDPYDTTESTIENNVHITVGCTELNWADNIETDFSSTLGPNSFTYYNGFKIIESETMVQIIYDGDMIIAQSINVTGKTLTLMSWSGNITINAGVILTADNINLFAKNGSVINNDTLTTTDQSNIFANSVIQGTINGNKLINTSLTRTDVPTGGDCSTTLPTLPLSLSLSGNTLSYTYNGATNPVDITTANVTLTGGTNSGSIINASGTLTIIYNGEVEITNYLDFSNSGANAFSVEIITPCDLNADFASTTFGEFPYIVSGQNLTLIVGGNVTSGSLVTSTDGGTITLTAGGDVSVTGYSTSNNAGNNNDGGWAGIGGMGGTAGAAGISPGIVTLTMGGNLNVIGGASSSTNNTNYGGSGSGIGGGGGGSDGTNGSNGGHAHGLIGLTISGSISVLGGDTNGSLNGAGAGAGIGGGGGAGGSMTGGTGGNANEVTLTSGDSMNITGGNTSGDSNEGAGAGIGGGGGNDAGGNANGNITLTAGSDIMITGGNANEPSGNNGGAGSGIGGGGGGDGKVGGNVNSIIITLTSSLNISITGGSADGGSVTNDGGAGAGIGGGGGGNTQNGGDIHNTLITLTAGTNISITGGSTSGSTNNGGAGADIGGGGGGNGGSGGSAIGALALLLAFEMITYTPGTGAGAGNDGEEATIITKYMTCFSIMIVNQTFSLSPFAPIVSFVGAILAIESNDSPLYFTAIDDNTTQADYFGVNPGGVITVASDLTSAPSSQTLSVQVYNISGTCALVIINIHITSEIIFLEQTFNIYNTTPAGTAISPNITISPSSATLIITEQIDPSGTPVINTNDFDFYIIGDTIYTNSASLSTGHYLLLVEASYVGYPSKTTILTINVQAPVPSNSPTGVLTVVKGASGIITFNLLNNAPGTIYTVISPPQYGKLLKNNVETLTFSQTNIDTNMISYQNTDTKATYDSFIYYTNTNPEHQIFSILIETLPYTTWEYIGWGALGGVICAASVTILFFAGYGCYIFFTGENPLHIGGKSNKPS